MRSRSVVSRASARRSIVFVAHSFTGPDLALVQAFKRSLHRAGFNVSSGERPESRRVSDKIQARIRRADIFLAILTRRHQIGGRGWTASPWVVEEKGYSLGQNPDRPIVLLIEDGIVVPDETGGMEGDIEYVRFDRYRIDVARASLRDIMSTL